jgi:hypothetical protein
MYLPPIHESATRERLLTGLGLAIEEAKMVRALLRKKDRQDRRLEDLKKLVNLDREIDYFETTLIEVLSQDDSEPA